MNIILHIYINCPEKTNVQRQKVEAESGCLKLGGKKTGSGCKWIQGVFLG